MPDTDKKENVKTVGLRPDIPTIYADKMQFLRRTDNSCILSWVQEVGRDLFVEQSRVMVSEEHMKRIINLICEHIDYYPEKKAKAKAK